MKNHIKTIVLLGSLSALVLGLGALVAPSYLYFFGALALAMNLGAYFFSDRIVLRMHGAKEVTPPKLPISTRWSKIWPSALRSPGRGST